MEDAVIVLIIFGVIFGISYVYFTTRNKERLALIEKGAGADAKLFSTGKKIVWRTLALQFGMFLIGISLGVIIAAILAATTSIDEEIAYPSMIFMFAGISLVLFYFLIKKLEN